MRNILSILILLLTFSVQGQISESWNLNIDTYTHSSSNYASPFSPVEIAEFSNGNKVILSQNGSFIKIDPNGQLIWRKELSSCHRQRVIIDANDNIIFSCSSEITKFNSNGELIWNKDFSSSFSKDHLTFDALTFDDDKIYVAGHFVNSMHICQLSIDKNGNVLWKKKFKQDVKYEFSFLPPKEIILHDNRIYVLAHHYSSSSNSFLYSSSILGKKRKEKRINYKIKKLKSKENSLFALGHLNNLKDKLIFAKIDGDLNLSKRVEFELPKNFDYQKAIRGWATRPPTKEEFEKKYITSYDINDFEFVNENSLIIVGNSYGKPWLASLDLDSGLTWTLDKRDGRYFKFDNDNTRHYYILNSIIKNGNRFLVTGISEEQDDHEKMFVKFINLFVREIEVKK